jgi:hypothetical protein
VQLYFAGGADAISNQNRAVQANADDDVQIIENNAQVMEQENVVDEDGVRRPIRPRQERLVDQSYRQYYGKSYSIKNLLFFHF